MYFPSRIALITRRLAGQPQFRKVCSMSSCEGMLENKVAVLYTSRECCYGGGFSSHWYSMDNPKCDVQYNKRPITLRLTVLSIGGALAFVSLGTASDQQLWAIYNQILLNFTPHQRLSLKKASMALQPLWHSGNACHSYLVVSMTRSLVRFGVGAQFLSFFAVLGILT